MYSIRIADEADAAEIASVHVASWQIAYRDILPEQYLQSLSVDRRADAWRKIISDAGTSTLVLEQEGRIVGFVNIGPTRDRDKNLAHSGEVYAIYLLEQHWGRGAGQLLFDRAVGILQEEGCREVVLWVLEENERARRFYEHRGLRWDGLVKVERVGGEERRQVRYARAIGQGG